MADKLTLTYKDRKLKIKLGNRELPLNALLDPAEIVLSSYELPKLRFEMLIDNMEIDDIEGFGKFVTKEEMGADEIDPSAYTKEERVAYFKNRIGRP